MHLVLEKGGEHMHDIEREILHAHMHDRERDILHALQHPWPGANLTLQNGERDWPALCTRRLHLANPSLFPQRALHLHGGGGRAKLLFLRLATQILICDATPPTDSSWEGCCRGYSACSVG